MGTTQRRLLRFGVLAVCVVAMAWTVRALGPRRVWELARAADPVWLALAVAAVGARFAIWGAKWRSMLRRRGEVPFGVCLRLILAGVVVNLTTPTAKLGGGVVRAVLLGRRPGWRPLEAYGWSLADQTTNVLGQWLLFGVLGLAAWPALPPGPLRLALAASGLLAVAGVLAFGAARSRLWRLLGRREVGRFVARLVPARFRRDRSPEIYEEWLGRILHPLLDAGGFGSAYLRDVLLGALGFAALCLSNAMVLRALGVEASPVLVSVAVLGGYLAGTLLGAWGGIGVTEAALTGLFVQAGVPFEQAAAGALVHRAIFYAASLAGGAPVLVRAALQRRRTSPPTRPSTVGDLESSAG